MDRDKNHVNNRSIEIGSVSTKFQRIKFARRIWCIITINNKIITTIIILITINPLNRTSSTQSRIYLMIKTEKIDRSWLDKQIQSKSMEIEIWLSQSALVTSFQMIYTLKIAIQYQCLFINIFNGIILISQMKG